VKRILTVAVVAVTAIFLLTALAAGQAAALKGSPAKITAKSKPKTDKKSPFKFKVTGAIMLPQAVCKPGTGGSCIPLNCAAGVTNVKYCSAPTLAQICGGKVRVTIKKGSKTLKKKSVNVNPATCTYSAKLSFKDRKKKKLRGVKAKVTVRFLGNTVLKAKSAKAFKVKVGKKK
jgi:hypothetical protein